MHFVEREPGDWQHRNGYFSSFEACCVCGSKHQTGLEPRFGYVVCEHHSKLSPVEVSEKRTDRK